MKVEIKKFAKGAFIYLESNSYFKEFYIIKSGQVKITRFSKLGSTEEMRSAGYIFGIVQCITGFTAEERALAVTECEILIIQRTQIEEMYNSNPKTILKIISEYSDILRKLDSELLARSGAFESVDRYRRVFEIANSYIQMREQDKAIHLLRSLVAEQDVPQQYLDKANAFLKKCPGPQEPAMDGVVCDRLYKKGDVVFTENELGNTLYIIKSGKIRISRLQSKQNREMMIAMLSAGDIFGEMAILNDKPRNATATVEENACLMVIKKEGINNLPSSMFLKILMLLTRRIWMVQQQLECCLTKNVLLKCYMFLLAKIRLKGFDPEKYPTKSCALKLTLKEICETLWIDENANSNALQEFQQDKNLVFIDNEIKIPRIGNIINKIEYLSKIS